MGLISSGITWFVKRRIPLIRQLAAAPDRAQQDMFRLLVQRARHTQWGKQYGYRHIRHYHQFREQVPISSYERIYPWIERTLMGERDVLWPGQTRLFSKSSGTTNARSKFIPVTQESLWHCHFQAGKDMIALYLENSPGSRVLHGKTFSVGGSLARSEDNPKALIGDVSALIMNHLPSWAQYMRRPGLDIALLTEWEEKIERMAQAAVLEDITSLSGVPTWMVVLIRKILANTGAEKLHDVFPNLEVFLHGAVSFGPYRHLFQELIGRPDMKYMELYNASEGFFGIQDDLARKDEMLLLLDYGIFYEFVPLEELDRDQPKAIPLMEVQLHKNYAMLISTNAGLWRYMIGDTVRFTSVAPYRIKISGRTKHFINAFGEELIVENAEAGIAYASQLTGAIVKDFTAGPVFMNAVGKGGHEWIIEFEKEPTSLTEFARHLDTHIRTLNSDYDAKRYLDMALLPPVIRTVPEGTFYEWLKSRGKLGGQHKVPRLANHRALIEEIGAMGVW